VNAECRWCERGHAKESDRDVSFDCRLYDWLTVLVFACLILDPFLFSSSLLILSHLSVMSSDLVSFSQWVNCVVAMSDGRKVVSGSYDKTLRVWDVDTGECVR
jgi:WD40 repeat protein